MQKPYIAPPGAKAVRLPILGGGYLEATEDTSLPLEPFGEGKFVRKQGYEYAVPGGTDEQYVEIWWMQV